MRTGSIKILNFTILIFCLAYSLKAQKTNPNGYNKFLYENGKVSSEGNMRDGKPDGYWINYHKSGKLKIEGNRKNFLLDSIWKFYDEKGRINKSISYLEGKKDGPTKIYDTLGNITVIENFEKDVKQGLTRIFHKNGKTKAIIPFINGKQEGTAYEYSTDSLITAITIYKGGILQSYEKINQTDVQNKKQGIWKEFYEDLQIKKVQQFNDDSLDGYVKEYDKKGNLIKTLKFNNGKQILKAPEIANVEVYREVFEDGTLKYEGVYSDGVAIGTHFKYIQKLQCDSSLFRRDDTTDIFINMFVCRNVPVPDSAIEYFDGVIIAKGAVDSLRNRKGLWIEYHNTGDFKGKGQYKDDNRIGEWEFFYASGKLEQKGKYDKKGRVQGVWKWYYEEGGLMREEKYVNGRREGEMIDYSEDGKVVLKGLYVDDKKEGRWIYETPEYLEYGNYVNGEPDSLWKSYYMPGKRKCFEGRFQMGVAEGLHQAYHPTGAKKYVGNYISGMKDGDWKYYDEFDYNYLTITYKNDIEIKWQGEKIRPTYEEGLRTYNVRLDENRTQRIRR